MSNTSDPAATTAGISAHPRCPRYPIALPRKVRVHALAKLLDRSSRAVLDMLDTLGEPARSAQSSLDRDVAIKVAELLLGEGAGVPAETIAAVEAAVEPEPEPDDRRSRRSGPRR